MMVTHTVRRVLISPLTMIAKEMIQLVTSLEAKEILLGTNVRSLVVSEFQIEL